MLGRTLVETVGPGASSVEHELQSDDGKTT